MSTQLMLSEHFSLKEFCDSEIAARRGFDNSLPLELLKNAKETAAMLERIRAALGGVPIYLSSGYRGKQVNDAAGSQDTSDHRRAFAADFRAPAFGTPFEVCRKLAPMVDRLGIGQLIYEHTWVHVGVPLPAKAINRIITVQGKGYIPGIVES